MSDTVTLLPTFGCSRCGWLEGQDPVTGETIRIAEHKPECMERIRRSLFPDDPPPVEPKRSEPPAYKWWKR